MAEWRTAQEEVLFSLREDKPTELTSSSLWAYFLRNQFGTPTRALPTDADWVVGLKLGYLLGLAPNIAAAPGEVAALERQRKALNQAISEGALQHLQLDEAQLRSELAGVSRERERLADQLSGFKVDAEYESNQQRANELSQSIKRINEDLLALSNRSSELERAINAELPNLGEDLSERRIGRMYSELGLVLPDQVSKRFDQVVAFHQSVARNRAQYLRAEQDEVATQIALLSARRVQEDADRANVMNILRSSVAFDTFVSAQTRVSQLDSQISDLERRLEVAASVGEMANTVKSKRAESERLVRQELQERQAFLVSGPLALFRELGSEVYVDRTADLLVSPTKNGIVKVTPHISGDASDGIRGVETFLLDMTLMVTSMSLGRSPGLLVHDSHLFDAVDHRQVASCLNIGARLAEEYGFQYIVTMNSDFVGSVVTEGSFDPNPYDLDVGLSDVEGGGIFGFSFD
ncbi:ABC-three component system protein [Pseudonocardia sp. MH-G8]|uniref:ABC-three component system protein n=1 Tax=Pseudonocardia sp. MH-G8 TaxID=1854588 RepID=UPI0013046D69|nr:ABC-three component system protein [Pseudonocardia sp. MH-G8]